MHQKVEHSTVGCNECSMDVSRLLAGPVGCNGLVSLWALMFGLGLQAPQQDLESICFRVVLARFGVVGGK